MSVIRKRAQEQFPAVLLTLLSIVQALALELLWEHLQSAANLFEITWISLLNWLQIVTTIIGIMLIWVAYASNAMRYRWTPTIGDSVYPFIIGLMEFWQLAMLGHETIGQWTILTGLCFGAMVIVSQLTLRSARLSGENGDFFDALKPATLRDFFPHIAIIIILILGGWYVWQTSNQGLIALLLNLLILALLVWQFFIVSYFWNISMHGDKNKKR
jgi:hypothetical protein